MAVTLRACVAVVAIVAIAAIVPAAAVADDPAENDTALEDDPNVEIADQLGDLVVHDYSYDSEAGVLEIEATWTGDRPTTTTATEMVELDSGGSTQISFEQVRLTPDETVELAMDVDERTDGTAAVLVTTSESIDEGDALVIQAGDPSTWGSVPSGWAAALVVIAAGVTGAGSFGVVRWLLRQQDDHMERIA